MFDLVGVLLSLKENLTEAMHAFSTLFGFLQLLLKPVGDKEQTVMIYPPNNRNVHVTFKEMKDILQMEDEESTDYLTKLEKSLKVRICICLPP